MGKIKLSNICKILCLVLCACFLLSACKENTGGNGQGTILYNKEIKYDENNKAYLSEIESMEDITAAHHSCLQGSILRVMYTNIGEMTTDVYKTLTSENLLSLVILAFTIWMAFQILKHVSSTTPESTGEFWTKVIRKAAICTICGILASTPDNILYAVNTFIFPIYVTILEFTSLIMEQLGKSPEAQTAAIKLFGFIGHGEQLCEAFVHKVGSCRFSDAVNVQMTVNNGFPTEPLELMSCMACVISDRLSIGWDIGLRLMGKAQLTAVVSGFFVMGIFFLTNVGFALYLIDSIFRLNMMVIILPFLIMFYPFEQTRKWSIKGLQIILSSASIMFCLGIIVTMTVFAMEKLLIDKNMRVPYGDPKQYMDFGVVALSLLFMAFVIKQSCGLAVKLAGHISGYGGETGFAKNVKSVVQWAGGIVLAALTMGASAAWSTAYKMSARVRKIQAQYEKIRNKINNLAGRDNDEE